jgi:hypothetical protein
MGIVSSTVFYTSFLVYHEHYRRWDQNLKYDISCGLRHGSRGDHGRLLLL